MKPLQQMILAGMLASHSAMLLACMEPDDSNGTERLALEATETFSGTVAKDQWNHLGPFTAAAGAFSARLTGDGDADLYVRTSAAPSSQQYDCRPYLDGSVESCSLAGPGQFFVSVQGYAPSSNYSLTVQYESADDDPDPPDTNLEEIVARLDQLEHSNQTLATEVASLQSGQQQLQSIVATLQSGGGQAPTIMRFEDTMNNTNGDIFHANTSYIAPGCHTELYQAQAGDVAIATMAVAFTDHGTPGTWPSSFANASFFVGVDTSGNPFPHHPGYSGCDSVRTQVGWGRKNDSLTATRVIELTAGTTYRFAPSIQFDPSDNWAGLYCSGSVVIYHNAQPVTETAAAVCN